MGCAAQATTNGKSSGYAVGVVSRTNVIFNNGAQDASVAVANATQTLSLCSFYGTPGYSQASPLSFNVLGAHVLQRQWAGPQPLVLCLHVTPRRAPRSEVSVVCDPFVSTPMEVAARYSSRHPSGSASGTSEPVMSCSYGAVVPC